MKSVRTMERFVKFLSAFNQNALQSVVILLPWLAPVPSAVFISIAAHDALKSGWVTAIVIGAFLDGFGIVSVALLTRLVQYNSQRLDNEPFAPVKNAKLLVGSYIFSALWLTVFLKITPVITEINPGFSWIEKIMLSVSYAIFPLITLSGAAALTMNAQHEELLARIAKERAEKIVASKKAAEKEARRIAKLEKDALKLAEQKRKLALLVMPEAQSLPVNMPMAIPDEYKNMISKKLANDPRYLKFFLEQIGRNGNGMMPVEEIMQLTGVPKKTAYNYAGYFKRDTERKDN